MDELLKLLKNNGVKRFLIFSLIAIILFSMKSMINFILFTFIFTFLMDRLVRFVSKRVPINRNVIVLVMYSGIVGILTYCIITYLPVIIFEISQLIKELTAFYTKPHDNMILNFIVNIIEKNELTNYLEHGVTFILQYFSDISHISIQIMLSLILSLFFLLEKRRLVDFSNKFKESKVAPFYNEIEFFSKKFASTFGKVIEAQFIIALFNCLFTTLALWILGFPQLFGLSIMIFFLGLIPVAGVIISLIPLSIIAYSIGGILEVVYIIVLITIIHALEAYILNPKLMSSKTDLPVFYTFIVLIFSEHFFGVWGLIVGIPIFVFLLDILEVTNKPEIKTDLKV